MAQEQIQLEFREELMQARQIQMALQQNPNDPALVQQANQLTQTMNARKAVPGVVGGTVGRRSARGGGGL